jgi:PTEN phosphatase family protein
MLQFCKVAERWVGDNPAHILAVHCRGGKGRSGSMICAWLLYSGYCRSASEALHFFGEKRTDKSKGSKFQGVETKSQTRFVDYFDRVLQQFSNARISNPGFTPPFFSQQPYLPPSRSLTLREIQLCLRPGFKQLCDWNDWHFLVTHNGGIKLSKPMRLSLVTETGEGSYLFKAISNEPVTLWDDFRFEMVGRNPKGKVKILFYWWHHTYFIESNEVRMLKDDVDRGRYKSCPFRSGVSQMDMLLIFDPSSYNPSTEAGNEAPGSSDSVHLTIQASSPSRDSSQASNPRDTISDLLRVYGSDGFEAESNPRGESLL